MKSLKNGTAQKISVKAIINNGLWLTLNDRDYFLSFDKYPYFSAAPVKEIFNVTMEGRAIVWESLDIDLSEHILQNPDQYPVTMINQNAIKQAQEKIFSEMGKRGGSAKSAKKTASSRANGKKGGRPRKHRNLQSHKV